LFPLLLDWLPELQSPSLLSEAPILPGPLVKKEGCKAAIAPPKPYQMSNRLGHLTFSVSYTCFRWSQVEIVLNYFRQLQYCVEQRCDLFVAFDSQGGVLMSLLGYLP